MNATAQPFTVQLESATRTFRDRHAKLHRAKSIDARARAREVLDMWDPLEAVPPFGSPFPVNLRGLGPDEPIPSTAWVAAEMTDALSMARWHEGRDNGQKYRFRKLAQCGTRVLIAQCRSCEGERKPIEEGCGIARLCKKCSLRAAKKRRARFGRARKRVADQLARFGCLRRRKVNGRMISSRWSDKMLTLTLPHFLRCELDEGAALSRTPKGDAIGLLAFALDKCHLQPDEVDATMARVFALRAAWPRFALKLRKHWKQAQGRINRENRRRIRAQRRDGQIIRGRARPPRARALLGDVMVPWKDGKMQPPPMHRAFEWTPGDDGLGHPHFHVWMLSPFIDANMVAGMWTEALREVGVVLEGRARIQLQRFQDFNAAATGELIKGSPTGQGAIEWSRLYKGSRARSPRALRAMREQQAAPAASPRTGPNNAFEYADGWTIDEAMQSCPPEIVASLYCALEKMRLTQGGAGLFTEDAPPHCEACLAQQCWHVRFEPAPAPTTPAMFKTPTPRGPPS